MAKQSDKVARSRQDQLFQSNVKSLHGEKDSEENSIYKLLHTKLIIYKVVRLFPNMCYVNMVQTEVK